jgi:hypothetical protein
MERILWASLLAAAIEVLDLLGPNVLGKWATPVRGAAIAITAWNALPIIATTALVLHAYVADVLARTTRHCAKRLIALLEAAS